MRLRAITLVFFLAGCMHAVPPAPAAPSAAPVTSFAHVQENAMSTQLVVVKDRGTGTAFVVTTDGLLLTCAHVVGDATSVEVHIFTAGATIITVATVEKVDMKTDLALLKAKVAFPETVIMGKDDDAGIGTETYAVGFPYEFGKIAVHGSIARLHLDVNSPEETGLVYANEMAIEMQGGPGTSGSGVFLRRNGALIGMVHIFSASPPGAPQMGFGLAIPVSKISAFLDAQRVKYHTR